MKNLIVMISTLMFCACATDNKKIELNHSAQSGLDLDKVVTVNKSDDHLEEVNNNEKLVYTYKIEFDNSPSDPFVIDDYNFRPFEFEGKWGYKYNGKVVILPEYSFAGDFIEGYSRVEKHGKWGYIDRQGNVVIDFLYERSSHFNNGLAHVQLNGKWGVINTNGETLLPFKYNYIGHFNEGLASVLRNRRYGFINKQFEEVIECKYDLGFDFHEGLAAVKLNSKWGYINKKGEVVIPFIYDDADRFRYGEAQVIKNGETFLIDMSGKRLDTPVTVDYLYRLEKFTDFENMPQINRD